jgi:hypothetical protein
MKPLKFLFALTGLMVLSFQAVRAQEQRAKINNLNYFSKKNEKRNATFVKLSQKDLRSARIVGERRFNKQFSRAMFAPNSTSLGKSFISNISQVGLESNLGEQKAVANVGFQSPRGHTFNFEAKQAFSEAPQKSVPISLDGLTDKSSVAGGYQFVFSKVNDLDPDSVTNTFFKIKEDQYVKTKRKKLRKVDKCDLIHKVNDSITKYYFKEPGSDTVEVNSFAKRLCCECVDTVYLALAAYVPNAGDSLAIHNMSYQSLDYEHKEMFREYLRGKRRRLFFINVKGGAEKNTFNYISDSADIAPVSVAKQNSYFKIGFGFFINGFKFNSALAFNFQMSDVYENDLEEMNYSFPVGLQGARFSKNVQIGAPTHGITNKVSVEWRLNFSDVGPLTNFALSPSIAYGIEKNAIAFNLPVYFLKNKDEDGKVNGLSGGINFGYNTSLEAELASFKDGFKASIFIAAPFDLFKAL